jgi:hypothetical protein
MFTNRRAIISRFLLVVVFALLLASVFAGWKWSKAAPQAASTSVHVHAARS